MTATRYDPGAQLAAIESALDAGHYRVGAWNAFVRRARQLPAGDRAAIAEDVSRVSRKLHARHPRRMLTVGSAVALELLATASGGVALAIGRTAGSNAVAAVAALVWVTTLQPSVKIGVGTMLGLRYDYAYLFGVEPRFKMRYGTYLAAPRWKRIVLHMSGMLGSPLGAWIAGRFIGPQLTRAAIACTAAFWATLAVNVVLFAAALLGRTRIGPLPLAASSGGMAAVELREVVGIRANGRA